VVVVRVSGTVGGVGTPRSSGRETDGPSEPCRRPLFGDVDRQLSGRPGQRQDVVDTATDLPHGFLQSIVSPGGSYCVDVHDPASVEEEIGDVRDAVVGQDGRGPAPGPSPPSGPSGPGERCGPARRSCSHSTRIDDPLRQNSLF
jgi:hypothetical protein